MNWSANKAFLTLNLFGLQIYHHCLYGVRSDFICANFTAFDQKTFICHFASEVDCKNSWKYWNRLVRDLKPLTPKIITLLRFCLGMTICTKQQLKSQRQEVLCWYRWSIGIFTRDRHQEVQRNLTVQLKQLRYQEIAKHHGIMQMNHRVAPCHRCIHLEMRTRMRKSLLTIQQLNDQGTDL